MADRSRGSPRGIAPAEDERDATESPDADERITRGVNVGERTRSPREQRTEPAICAGWVLIADGSKLQEM